MKTLILLVFVLFAFSCSDQVEEVPVSNLSDHNMKIIPEKPTSKDEIKLVVYDDCTYNVLSEIKKEGNGIEITKQYNSMMKWPCIAQNDTILLGKLPEGIYRINYRLFDTSTQVENPVAISFYFMLTVAKQ